MSTSTKEITEKKMKLDKKRVTSVNKKNPAAFFGKLKDGVDGLAYQKKLRGEWD